ncbi:T9SS type A sorting domain-containing protein [Chryseobacterium arachidis]
MSVYDMSGKLVNAPFSNGQINVSMLPKGVYILTAKTEKAVYQQKVIKN